ncbi:PBSX family phage terminase large subunit [Desulfovibrio sp. OttesenSCG-928-C14]|nr:PBSX family phage terminase large subunit [Desulfovibrio sp. OttesenSCG-928-C14]
MTDQEILARKRLEAARAIQHKASGLISPENPFMKLYKGDGGSASGTLQDAALPRVEIAESFEGLFRPYRYKILYGGRGGAKSWAVGRVLALKGAQRQLRILCAREFQTSIKDSVIALLKDQIRRIGLKDYYKFGATYIEGKNGTEFIFKGLRINPDEIKSMEGVDICWVEEAQRVSEDSWTYLIPTIRKEGSEIWATLNPVEEDDATYKRFVVNTPPNTLLVKVNWNDNPWFPETLNQERLYCLSVDPEAYSWIWEGNPRKISEAVIFKGKYIIETFEVPRDAKLLQGADWGFGPDPTVLTQWFIKGNDLFVPYESYHHLLDLDDIAETWRRDIPGSAKVKTYADGSQPQTIRHVRSHGYRITAAKKYPGSVEEGVRYMRSFARIHVHERCKHTATEFGLYSYKTDRITKEIMREIKDQHNHCMDTGRYALSRQIRRFKEKSKSRRSYDDA